MFCTQALKAEADVQHLWFGRRAATRIRAELMSAIYDKALKRKDFSGIVNKDKEMNTPSGDGKKDKKAEKAKKEKADDPKAGADVGKIVNLMAGDANRVSRFTMLLTCSHLHCYHSDCHDHFGHVFHLWGSLWYVLAYQSLLRETHNYKCAEIVIAATFLYQLLGFSAFAGFLVLILGWPLNSFLSKRAIRISKGVLAARDKRMGVLNELIGAVRRLLIAHICLAKLDLTGQVHQVLCLGRPLDRASAGSAEEGD